MANNLETFSAEFKRDCLSFLLKDELAAKAVIFDLPVDFFEYDPEYHTIFIALRDFMEKYNCRPNRHEIVDIITDIGKKAGLSDEDLKVVFDALKDLWKWKGYSAAYVKDKLYDAITSHSIYQVLKQAADFVDEGDYDGLLQAMAKARVKGSEAPELLEYWADSEARVERVRSSKVARIPTGMPLLDEQIKGGLPRGNISMLMGGSGFGKSALLGQYALHASTMGYTVAYLTLELSSDLLMLRCDARNTGVRLNDIDVIPAKRITKKMREYYHSLAKTPGPMYVQYFPTKSISIHQIEDYVRRLRDEEGVTLDLLVVDYFDLLKMAGTYTKKYEALEENVEMLRGLAGQYNMAIWTASQVNRGGLDKDNVDMEDIAAGFGKVFPLDLLITISQTKKERTDKVFRLTTAKSRIGPAGGTIWVEPNFDIMRFQDISEADAASRGLLKKDSSRPSKPSGKFGTQVGL